MSILIEPLRPMPCARCATLAEIAHWRMAERRADARLDARLSWIALPTCGSSRSASEPARAPVIAEDLDAFADGEKEHP
jgi:hypothetical protein